MHNRLSGAAEVKLAWVLIVAMLIAAPVSAQTFTNLHTFTGTDGGYPSTLIQAPDGSFYGTTSTGMCCGTVFRMSSAGAVTTLHWFSGADGRFPIAGVIQATDGKFYGTTDSGGTDDKGTVFQIDTAGTLTTLHSFNGADGRLPFSGLIQAADGSFYGTTYQGGSFDLGTVFKLDTVGILTTLHSFNGADGRLPYSGLIQAADGSFYGTTSQGGSFDLGTVFKLDATGTLLTLHSFNNADGALPTSALIQAADGTFYGTTVGGGSFGGGTVYKTNATGTLSTLYAFANDEHGMLPYGGLVQAADGDFYGTTRSAPSYGGTVFKLDAMGVLTTLYSFNGVDGAEPVTALIEGTDMYLYGTTEFGGVPQFGTVFRINISPPPTISGVPVDRTVEATGPSGAMVVYTAPTATDLVDGSVPVNCAPLSGATFPLGTTTVTCSATDSRGSSTSAIFVVNVVDTTKPELSLPPNVSVNATMPTGAIVNYSPAPIATDLVSGTIIPSCTRASGSTFPIGTTIVTCTATDSHLNQATGSFTVSVAGAADQLQVLKAAVIAAGSGASLADKVQTAISALQKGNAASACGVLADFISAVQAQVGKKLTQAQAAQFQGDAVRIRAVIGC